MLAAGSTLGPYKVLAPLGAGGMGEVYRAQDPRLGRDVAIKVLSAEFAVDPDRTRRLGQEARAAGALSHPNVCAIHDVGTHEGAPFLVMELLEGETLRERLATGPLALRKAIDFAAQVALGLAAAHEKGIIHRDLKPENLFVTRDGHAKILDFGLAKQLPALGLGSQTESPTQAAIRGTQPGVLLGTVGYMSPEQVRGEPADARSDIFSLGCVLYEMLAGRRPFQKQTAVETLNAILNEDPPSLASSSRAAPRAVEQIVTRCLEKRPEDRFASASDLHFALQSLLQNSALELPVSELPEKSIVVLPFENLSPDPENAYFADGLTEEIISDLAQVRALRVISRTSAMLLRGSKKDVPTIARELRVRYALEGSVRRAGQSLRITTQLIDAVADTHLWAEKYTGSFEDVFDMQEKVSRAIVEALRVELTPQEQQRMAERPIPNVHAYECYLKAREEIWRCAARSLDRAMEHLEEGLRAMPHNPLLLAGVAYVHFQRANMAVGQEDSLRQAEAFATRALNLAPGLPQAHVVLGLIAAWRPGMVKTAIAHFDRVLAADPQDLDGLKWLGVFSAFLGRTAAAAAMGEKVIAMDPMSTMSYWSLVFAHWLDGRLEAAEEVMNAAAEADPGESILKPTKAVLLIEMGRRDEGMALAGEAERDEPLTVVHRIALLWRYALAGDPQKALSWMTPEVLQTCRRDLQYSWWVACAYVLLGDAEAALDWLGNAINVGFLNARYLGEIDSILAPLRGDPRFQSMMDRARKMQAELEARP